MVLLGSLLALTLSGCLTVPDVPVCAEINPDKAYCVYTLSDKEQYWDDETLLDGKTYWESKPSLILLPPQSWAKIKSYIIKSCKKYGGCDQGVIDWESKIDIEKRLEND